MISYLSAMAERLSRAGPRGGQGKGAEGPEAGARVLFQADPRDHCGRARKTHGADSIMQTGHVPTLIIDTSDRLRSTDWRLPQ